MNHNHKIVCRPDLANIDDAGNKPILAASCQSRPIITMAPPVGRGGITFSCMLATVNEMEFDCKLQFMFVSLVFAVVLTSVFPIKITSH